ncbi:MAG TPA: phosphoribosylamine--glycine ligase [Clostridiales bacterium]|nr:phosphoribosylamine--glycine ligase [Clostridiales bacterium]
MNILVIGSGGREHAIVWKLSKSKHKVNLWCAPGNGGISQLATCVDIKPMEFDKIVSFSKEQKMDLVVVAPDDPLASGLVDILEANDIPAFGPSKSAARLEGSKAFSKDFMKKHHIPTADYQVFDDATEALKYIEKSSFPIVVKADGLALGKGVIIAQDKKTAVDAVHNMMEEKKFGDAGNKIVIEEFLTGPEVSVLTFSDGKTLLPMVSSQDHKRAFDHDKGLNTGGMGAFAPSKIYSPEIEKLCQETIFKPTLEGLRKEGIQFKGVLYFGLILTPKGPYVLEYNARFGDPETQVVLPLMKNDLLDVFMAVIEEQLEDVVLEWEDKECVCVVLASGGYPVSYKKGYEIKGLERYEASQEIFVFHAGTQKADEKYITAGGRVLGVTAKGENMEVTRQKAYEAVKNISFTDMHYRTDIGVKK